MISSHFGNTTPNLSDMQRIAVELSERWFPTVHDRDKHSVALHYTLGLAGEVGEVVELIKKAHRKGKVLKEIDTLKLEGELADVLSYLMDLAEHFKIDLAAAWWSKMAENERRYLAGGWGG